MDILENAEFLAYLSAVFTTFLIICCTFVTIFYFWLYTILQIFKFFKFCLWSNAILIFASTFIYSKCNFYFIYSYFMIWVYRILVFLTKYFRNCLWILTMLLMYKAKYFNYFFYFVMEYCLSLASSTYFLIWVTMCDAMTCIIWLEI